MHGLAHDLRFALRMLRKRPSFAAVAILALALGIGANSAVFSIVNATILHPLAFPDLDRIVEIRETSTQRFGSAYSVSPADYLDWKERSRSFQSLAAYVYTNHQLGSDGADPAGVFGARFTASMLATLAAKPAQGRGFAPDEETPGKDDVAIISDGLWRERFASDPTVLGRTILLDRKPHTIIGIMPRNFDFPLPRVAVWTPLTLTPEERANRKTPWLHVVGRLKDGISKAEAESEMQFHTRRLASEYPDTNASRSTDMILLRERQIEFSAPYLTLLQAAAAFVLLIACANLANLQLAHGVARSREIAMRAALGAGRWRVARLLLIESVVIALAGGIAGVAVAYGGVELLKRAVPPETAVNIVGWNQVALHLPVLIFTLSIAVAAGVLFGLSAAWRASKVDLSDSLKDGGQQGGVRSKLRPALVIAEVTLAVVAVIGATQMVRGFQAMFAAYQGFTPDRILAVRFAVPATGYETSAKWSAFVDRALTEAASLPETESVTASSNLPGALQFNPAGVVELEGAPVVQRVASPTADLQIIGANYFATLNIPIIAGRPIEATDSADTPPVIVVNQRFASRFWPGENAIGRRIRFDANAPAKWRTVVGVVADVNQFWFQRAPRPVVFVPYRQASPRGMYLAIRTHREPLRVLPLFREQIRKIDASLPLYNPRSMDQLMQETMSAMQMTTGMMMAFGLLALILAAIGVYGVMAYSITQRHREFGIRIALGAHPRAVLGMVLRQALLLATIGGILGLGTGVGVSRAMAGIMYGVGASSLPILLGAPLLLGCVCLLASWIPARAVMVVNPAAVLRRD